MMFGYGCGCHDEDGGKVYVMCKKHYAEFAEDLAPCSGCWEPKEYCQCEEPPVAEEAAA